MDRKIKYVIHISDIHIRKVLRHKEYREVFGNLYSDLESKITPDNRDEFLIVITGDIVHQKIEISNEQIMLIKEFLLSLLEIADVVMIAGNHDMLVNNKDRLDSLTPIVDGIFDDRLHFLTESESIPFHNIVFQNFSVFEDNRRPNIEASKEKYPNHIHIGLYHAPLQGAKTELGFSGFDYADNPEVFKGCDLVMCGDIHLYQEIKSDIPIIYAGSLIQQGFGENLSGHGYLIWNIISGKQKLVEVENPYTFVKVKLSTIDELNNIKIVNE